MRLRRTPVAMEVAQRAVGSVRAEEVNFRTVRTSVLFGTGEAAAALVISLLRLQVAEAEGLQAVEVAILEVGIRMHEVC